MKKVPTITRNVTWDEIEELVDKLAAILHNYAVEESNKILPDKNKCRVWGIPRGGIIIAALLAHRGFELAYRTYPCAGEIIVDEIADTGETLHGFAERGIVNKTAALFVRYNCKHWPDFAVEVVNDDKYLLMPWEVDYKQ